MRHTVRLARCAALLASALACERAERSTPAVPRENAAVPDSAAVATAALDTLRRLGAKDYVVDSLVRTRDTVVVWCGPREWMATDRPTSGVTVVVPARVIGIQHIMGG